MRFSSRALLFCGGLFSDGRFSFRASREAVNGEGALRRSSKGRAFVYRAVESREALMEHVSRRVVEGLLQDFGALAVAQFMDALDTVDPQLVADLQARVKARGESGGQG